jgi:hypothetical protein
MTAGFASSTRMRACLLAIAVAALFSNPSLAADGKGKGIRFWNLTSSTVTTLQLSPAGQNAWGANQCANDPDGAVDHDERLRIVGIAPGRYDAKLADRAGRTCIVRNLDIKENGIFSIEDKDLTGCGK